MFYSIPNCISLAAVLKYRATAAHFTPIGLPCSKIALTRSFYTTAVAIAVRKLVGAEHEDVVTYEKSLESLASPLEHAFRHGCGRNPEMWNDIFQCKTSLLDFATLAMTWRRPSPTFRQTPDEFIEELLKLRQQWKSLQFFEHYTGKPHEIQPISKDCNYDTFRKQYLCDFSSLERRVSGLGYTHQI